MKISEHALQRFRERVNPTAGYGEVRREFYRAMPCDVASARAAIPIDPSKPSNPDLIVTAELGQLFLNLDCPCYFIVKQNCIVTVLPGPEPDVCSYLRKKLEEPA